MIETSSFANPFTGTPDRQAVWEVSLSNDAPAEAALSAADGLIGGLQAALVEHGQQGWSRWLNGEIQGFLPHDALIAAWGNFRTGEIEYDVITRGPALSMDAFPRDIVEPAMSKLFERWLAAGQTPVGVDTRPLRSVGSPLFSGSPCALVHGVQDYRSHYDCIYVVVGQHALSSAMARRLFLIALPFIDTAFRQLSARDRTGSAGELSRTGFACSSFADATVIRRTPDAAISASAHRAAARVDPATGNPGGALSARELEIMKWVRMGKTNSEIAIILNLSTFTVKNHMRRIYKKLDVLNRAQAVGSLDRVYAAAAPEYAHR
jgi:transcriptional regulator EpsA